jgi:large subunit ribosomal protein L21
MSKIAVIKTGGKQYKVAEGDKVKLEKLPGEANGKVTFDQILLVSDSKSGESKIGNPLVKGAKVEAKVLEQGRDKKVKVVKYKSKTRYTRVYGHRQPYTEVEISKISG